MLLSHIGNRTVSVIPIFLFKWKIQKLLLMYIGGSSIILRKKFPSIGLELAKKSYNKSESYPLDCTIN